MLCCRQWVCSALVLVAACQHDTGIAHETRAPQVAPTITAPAADDVATAAPALAASVASPHVTTAPAEPHAIDFAGIDPLVAQAIEQHRMPGCVVVIGNRDHVLFERAYGQRALLPTPEPMTLGTRFDLASLSKSIATSIAVMQLVEAGKLTLDTPAVDVLPELNTGIGRSHKRKITIRQLLLHSSGLPAVTPLSDYEHPRDVALSYILKAPPIDKPGARFVYSDVGYIALGEIVARVSGMPLDAYARTHIFEPLGMSHTTYGVAGEQQRDTAPTELGTQRDGDWMRGTVNDPRAYRLGGIAGNAGVFSTAGDLARLARALLNHGAIGQQRVLSARALARMTEPHFVGDSVRALGWDMSSTYSRNGGDLLSSRAYGHGGYTGTSLWIDPAQNLFVLFLSNRVHPDGTGNVIELEGAIANYAVTAITRVRTARNSTPTQTSVQVGIDVLRAEHFARLSGKSIGLVTNDAARASDGDTTFAHFKRAKAVTLKAMFTPEHGLNANHEGLVRDDAVADDASAPQSVPVFSLFGTTRKPTPEMLAGIDTLVFDLQDVGVRFYTYASTLVQVLEAAHENNVHVVVLDRPNPLGGVAVEGPLQDEGVHTFVNYHRLPVRHGLTIGELAQLLNSERNIHASLEVVTMTGWQPQHGFEATGLTWTAPSPNLRTTTQAWLYPALGLLESTNLTVGRGTGFPFEIVGAPWLNAINLAKTLTSQFPDMTFVPMRVTPTSGPYRGESCNVVHVGLADRSRFKPVVLALAIAQALALTQPQWKVPDLYRLLAHRAVMSALRASTNVANLDALWRADLLAFMKRSELFLLYAR